LCGNTPTTSTIATRDPSTWKTSGRWSTGTSRQRTTPDPEHQCLARRPAPAGRFLLAAQPARHRQTRRPDGKVAPGCAAPDAAFLFPVPHVDIAFSVFAFAYRCAPQGAPDPAAVSQEHAPDVVAGRRRAGGVGRAGFCPTGRSGAGVEPRLGGRLRL